ncbi:hypothetical protein [Pseudomonas extremaustralis]|uniref:hypothetical protein n=1 Tax=Pseudomonas extremaustralis TaxID=359110 RepID=UPI002307F73F|nr:hypothetical protein [Pseudomonas extremaustralis]MDB1111354.1 hypothetical protein [Pseudomonas extremaustralis]
MTSDLSEEEMRRALFGDAEPAPLVTPPPVPEATAELVFENPDQRAKEAFHAACAAVE